MNAMERLGALMSGRRPDRAPIIINLIDQGAPLLGLSPRDYFADPARVAEGQLRLRERFGYDNLWSFQYSARDAELLGSRHTIFAEEGPPNVGHLIIESPRDIERLQIPEDLSDAPQLRAEARTVALLKAEDEGRHPVLSAVIGSFSMPALLMGVDRWMDLMLVGPEEARRALLTKCSDYCARKIRALRAAGVDMISYSNPLASAAFLNVSQFRALALEWILRDVAEVGGEGLVYFNGGGPIGPMLPDLLEATPFGAYALHPADAAGAAREIIAGRALLAASINDIPLLRWSDEEIDAEVARIMTDKEPGGFIFGTLMMPTGIPERAIHALVAAARRHGAYV